MEHESIDALKEELERVTRECDKLLLSEDRYHQENERLRTALRKIANGNHAGFMSHIRWIANEALAEPVE